MGTHAKRQREFASREKREAKIKRRAERDKEALAAPTPPDAAPGGSADPT